MRSCLAASAFFVLVSGCARAPLTPASPKDRAPSAPVAANESSVTAPATASAESEARLPEPALPDVQFDREVTGWQIPEDTACGFDFYAGLEYDDRFYVRGRPFASAGALGAVKHGQIRVPEGTLFAPAELSTKSADIRADVSLRELPLYAKGPIVYDGWLHIHKTRIATQSSVQGPYFEPDLRMGTDLRLAGPAREGIRIPCGMVAPRGEWPDVDDESDLDPELAEMARHTEETQRLSGSADGAFPRADGARLTAPQKIIGISRTPTGPAVAEIVHPDGRAVKLLAMYKTTALIAISEQPKDAKEQPAITLVGWIHEGELDDGGARVGPGSVGTIGHGPPRFSLQCEGVDVFVKVGKELFDVVSVNLRTRLVGAYAANGDFRVDLGGNPHWSSEKPPKDASGEPLDPFVPKEYLTRCR